jgi:hypothetical protein
VIHIGGRTILAGARSRSKSQKELSLQSGAFYE